MNTQEAVRSLRAYAEGYAGNIRGMCALAADLLETLVPRWISVEESVPLTTDDVLCYVTSGFQFVGYFEGIRGRRELYGQSRESVTHWMPLPEPPKEE